MQPDRRPLDRGRQIVQTVGLEVHGNVIAVDALDADLLQLTNTVIKPGTTFIGAKVTIRLRGPQRVLVRIETTTVGDTFHARWGADLKMLHGALFEGTLRRAVGT
ncbi:hypothetical protein ACX80V_16745 [Arthrobacter sp. MDT3-24]